MSIQFNRSLNQAVGKYKFNSSGVCENPEVILEHDGNKYQYCLQICEGPAGWLIGYDLTVKGIGAGTGSWSCAPSKKGAIYYSREIASIDVANMTMEYFNNAKSKELDPLRALIKSMDEYRGSKDEINDALRYVTGTRSTAVVDPVPANVENTDEIKWDLDAPKKTPLVKFVTMRAATSKAERSLFSDLGGDHAGDWLNDPTSMFTAHALAQNAVKRIQENKTFKYARYLSVEIIEKPYSVDIYSTGYYPGKEKKELLCQFVPYTPAVGLLTEMIKETLIPSNINELVHPGTKEKDIAELWRPDGPNDLNAITKENALKYKSMFTWKIPQAEQNFQHFTRILQAGKFDPGLTKEAVEDLAERQRVFKIQLEAGMEQVKFILSSNTTKKMALSKTSTGPGTSSMTMVPIGNIIPSPTNKLHREPWELDEKQDSTFADLIKSIQQRGVDQSLLARPNEKKGMFYLVCGERRLTAAKKAGLKEVPCMVKALNDDEAFEAQITENLQRKDVHALKEGESYEAYMKQTGATIEDLVAKFAKTREYIMQRLSFTQLIPELRKDFYANKMGAGHAALFARLTPANQKQCFQNCKVQYGAAQGEYKLIDDVKAYITQSIMMELKDVPWDLKDSHLVPAAGSCAACPKRSGAGLFQDVSQKDRCFDKACFNLKFDTNIIDSVTSLVKNNPTFPVIKLQSHDITNSKVKELLEKAKITPFIQYKDFEKSDAGTKGSVRALIIAGPTAGCFQQIKLKKQAPQLASSPSSGGSGAKAPVVPLQKKIADAQAAIVEVQDEINIEIRNQAQKKLFDFKPYNSPDNKPLTKYEFAAFFMAIDQEVFHKTLPTAMKSIKVPGMKPTDKGYTIEQFANMPQDLKNWMMRMFLENAMDQIDDDDQVYLTAKLAEENTAMKIELIKAAAEKKYIKELTAAKKKLDELKAPPAPNKPAPKKSASKKK